MTQLSYKNVLQSSFKICSECFILIWMGAKWNSLILNHLDKLTAKIDPVPNQNLTDAGCISLVLVQFRLNVAVYMSLCSWHFCTNTVVMLLITWCMLSTNISLRIFPLVNQIVKKDVLSNKSMVCLNLRDFAHDFTTVSWGTNAKNYGHMILVLSEKKTFLVNNFERNFENLCITEALFTKNSYMLL